MKFTQIVAAVFLAASAYAATADTAATDAAAVAGQFQRGCLDLCLDIATDCAKRGRRDNCDREFKRCENDCHGHDHDHDHDRDHGHHDRDHDHHGH